MRLLAILTTVLLLGAIAWAGNVYMWKDESGVVRLGDKPPAKEQSNVQSFSGKSGDVESPVKAKAVELFVTRSCPYCVLAEKHLKKRGVSYEIYYIDKDKNALRRKRELSNGYRGVPFAMIYGRPVRGFSPQTYDRHINAGK